MALPENRSAEHRRLASNELIKVPRRLHTDDGREVLIQIWEPRVGCDEATSVTLTGLLTDRRSDESDI